jgi:hypothetical protein
MNNYRDLDQYDYFDSDYFNTALVKYGDLIGMFLMHFSSLEHELNIAVAEIINDRTHEIGYSIIEGLTIRNKIELFYRMHNKYAGVAEANEKKTAMVKEKLKAVRSSLNIINDFRNIIAHANWETIQKGGRVRVKFASDKESGMITFKNVVIKPKDIREKIKEIEKLKTKIYFYKDYAFRVLRSR